jgi:hypothetical protein
MDEEISKHTVHGGEYKHTPHYIASVTITRLEHENVAYTRKTIVNARFQAVHCCGEMDFVSEKGLIECWEIAHILTSDGSWGSGESHLVNDFLKMDVEYFFAKLLRMTECTKDDLTVVSYMIDNIAFVHDRCYIILLRAYMFGYPNTLWCRDEVDSDNTGGIIQESAKNITALQFCCHTDVIPLSVLKILLEGDALVDTTNDGGDTPLMMAVVRRDGDFPLKVKALIDYGARIDTYNLCFQNSLHIAVAGQNMKGVSIILEARRERIRCATEPSSIVSFDTRLQERCALDPDPLHFPDEDQSTPLVIAVNFLRNSYKTRRELMSMLIDAGADGDTDIHRENRAFVAKRSTTGAPPPCYGIITCHLFEDFVIYVTIHKDNFCMELKADLNILSFCLDESKSILPIGEFDIEEVWLACRHQRFDFSSEVDGLDFDVHFDVMKDSRGQIKIRGCNDGTAYKLSIRFPRGPFLSNGWVETLSEGRVFSHTIVLYKGHTLAHHAVLCPNIDMRRSIVNIAIPVSNPLRKCVDGFTATETIEALLRGTVMPWQVSHLVGRLRKNQDAMFKYILKDTESDKTTIGPRKNKKTIKRTNKCSPFHQLSDDVCRMILSYM